jgi:hypothetical protein
MMNNIFGYLHEDGPFCKKMYYLAYNPEIT